MTLLAVDVGNTQTVFGLFEGATLEEHWRVATEAHRTGDELGALVGRFIDLGVVDGVCVSLDRPRARSRVRGVRRTLGEGTVCS